MFNLPKRLNFSKNKKNINLIIKGQGVFVFNCNNNKENSSFNIYNEEKNNGLKIIFTFNGIEIYNISTNEKYEDINNTIGLSYLNNAFYWFSLDSQNQILRAGIGETRLETVIYEYKFINDNDYEINKQFLESLSNIEINNNINCLKLLKDPVINKIPLVVKNSNDITIDDIAENIYMPKSFLSYNSCILYDSVCGNNFVLNTKDFPNFSKAIEYSIKTEGCWCNNKLKEKSTEFDKDKPNLNETYLRITLGKNSGESPGIPYVLEIWPVGHYSPIHSHANTDAIIRVLRGEINVKLYPFLCPDKNELKPFAISNLKKNEITWISPDLNQVHQLKNLETNTKACITMNCYIYTQNDNKHYDYFDYIDSDNKLQQYEPDSDMDFVKFKQLMKTEWNNRSLKDKLF